MVTSSSNKVNTVGNNVTSISIILYFHILYTAKLTLINSLSY